MSLITQIELSANLQAALLLKALTYLRALGLPHPCAATVFEATGAKKTSAYALSKELPPLLLTLERPPGRPAKDKATHDPGNEASRMAEVTKSVLTYLYEHPGAAGRGCHRSKVSNGFKQHIVALCLKNSDINIEQVSSATCLPASTVREWIRKANNAAVDASQASTSSDESARETSDKTAQQLALEKSKDVEVQLVLEQHRTWAGSFTAFVEHLHRQHKVQLGRTAITSILKQAAERLPKKRPGRSPDDKATRAAFCNFFPGAQWTADGTEVSVTVKGHAFTFNLELSVDTCSGAFVGLDIRDHEDANSVVACFEEGVSTTGAAPLAFLLDNKNCNHCPDVDMAIGDTLCIPATLARPQNKGHVEGAFGLFAQQAPELRLDAMTDKGRAQELVELCVRVFFGALNMRPRKQRGGRSRIELYTQAAPTTEQVEHAKLALQARLDQQRKARKTLRERQCPEKRTALARAFERFGFTDESGHILDACARYPLDAILDGIAIFEGKRHNASLPEDLHEPARYLLGIIRNIDGEREGMAIALSLWNERLQARERIFDALFAKRESILRDASDMPSVLGRLVDLSLETDIAIEQHFWLVSITEQILSCPQHEHRELFTHAARRVHTTYASPRKRQRAAVRFIAAAVLPVHGAAS